MELPIRRLWRVTYPITLTLGRCSQSGNYRAERYPTCGCRLCWKTWIAKATLKPDEFKAIYP